MKLHERFSALSPIYGGGLTNHLPMMITALRLLDVDDEKIEEIAEEYLDKKYIVDLSNSGIENDFFNDEYVRLTNFFMNEISHKSVEEVLEEMLNENQYALHSGLFHGVIRIAYGYLEGNDLLIAQGLAYFSLIAEPLMLKGEAKENIEESFQKLVEVRKGLDLNVDGTTNKLNVLQQSDEIMSQLFHPVSMLKHKEETLKFFVNYYNKTKDFYMLHAITGYHALHVLSQFFVNQEEVFNNFFKQALLVMLIFPHNKYLDQKIELESFAALVKRVPDLRDAHDIKLFYSLAYFYERYELDELIETVNLIFN